MNDIVFIDTEITIEDKSIKDFGAINSKDEKLHTGAKDVFISFIKEAYFLCGHNIIKHDLYYLNKIDNTISSIIPIDTLVLSPLLFPEKPYHKLIKDDKLFSEQLNNPLNDAIQARDLFYDEVSAFNHLEPSLKNIYYGLLHDQKQFLGFFKYIGINKKININQLKYQLKSKFKNLICGNVNLSDLILNYPVELAYCLAIIATDSEDSITPKWVLMSYPEVERLLYLLRNNPCVEGCPYCNRALDAVSGLKTFFGYDAYRTFDGEPLQEKAVTAALHNKSLLAVFPTGGGKSITFQIPALMSGKATRGLTVVISPLQSLMKDQVDNLERSGRTDAVTINGMLDPIERAKSFERVEDGSAKILYISPESLRSVTIERLLLGRKIIRFVIDEAHCFSAWGQDFRVDYLYIADFIKGIVKKKNLSKMIPVSCFTATAKQNVIEDIKKYFKEKLNLDLMLFTASAARKNLYYKVINCAKDKKYERLRLLIEEKKCPTIIYVSRTRMAEELAAHLVIDGYLAKAYHGKMDKQVKSEHQDQFIHGEVDIMVATSAFGMGVDKKDVGLVIHYQISDSLENYVQEAGRAGRDQSINAECFVLFDDGDLNEHFTLLNQTKLNINEISQVWKAIKDSTRYRSKVSQSALEIARKAGWDDSVRDIDTRVKTAVSALEQAGYIKRGQNSPRVYADSILSKNMQDASERIRNSKRFVGKEQENAIRIIGKLISARSRKSHEDENPESRIDYISDQLGIKKVDVIRCVHLLREEEILSDTKDLTAFLYEDMTKIKALNNFKWYKELESFLITVIDEDQIVNIKEINEAAEKIGLKKVTTDKIITLLNFWTIKHYIEKETSRSSKNHFRIRFEIAKNQVIEKFEQRTKVGEFVLSYLYNKKKDEKDKVAEFSVLEIKTAYEFENQLFRETLMMEDVENALFYLSRIGALKIEGGFLVLYSALTIERLERDNRIQYKIDDYKTLDSYYKQKVQQIHIVGEYAKKMLEDYERALEFVDDYFQLNYQTFLSKYFIGTKGDEIQMNITPEKFRQLFGTLSPRQLSIVKDKESKYIVVAAGPGSGKTRILVHKLAALLLMEDVKHEQLLMVTFSRAAATEFKKRLIQLIGPSANYVDIKTFHSFCFDVLGRVGDVEKSENIVRETAQLIMAGEVETSRITKTVMVIDEAQDMDIHEFNLVREMVKRNENMRVIAVGDDDQNIFAFRGASSAYMKKILTNKESKFYELIENYRSMGNIVSLSNHYVRRIADRMKTTPIMAVQNKLGKIELMKYAYDNVMDGVVNKFLREGAKGSICILTATNNEALQITGRLRDKQIRAKLIQTNEKVLLTNLDEVRFFIEALDIRENEPIIDPKTWEAAKYQFSKSFVRSEYLEMCKSLFKDFEIHAGKYKYVSDFMIFLRESKLEDFIEVDQETIQVSTMHKSKGREFDTVILMLNQFSENTIENKRLLYVAMTRAKSHLQIHYKGDALEQMFKKLIYAVDSMIRESKADYQYNLKESLSDTFSGQGIYIAEEKNPYRTDGRLVLQLNYYDVYLSFFNNEDIQKRIRNIRSGDWLNVSEKGCFDHQGKQIVLFSKKFKSELSKHLSKGFMIVSAKVHLVVYWAEEDSKKEVRVILPEIKLKE